MRITSNEQAQEVINRFPEIEPVLFWDSVGVDVEVAVAVGRWASRASAAHGTAVPFSDAMALMEIGATLAKEGLCA